MASEYIDTHIASRLLCLKERTIQVMCKQRVFSTAFKPGMGKQARWRILRAEVIERKINSHAQPYS